jgi:hypothetical protein
LGFSNRPDRKSPSSVATTGFLPGVLSFLCALSHLERVAHRPRNLFFQLQSPLSPGESVVQTGQQATCSPALCGHNNQWGKQTRAFQTGSTMTGWSHGYGFGTEIPHTGSICSDRGCIRFSRNQHRLSLKSTHRLRPPVSEWHEVSCRGRMRHIVQKMHGDSSQRSDGFTPRQLRVEWWRNPPTRLISDALFACAWVDTCHPCNYHAFHPFGSYLSFQKNLG